MTENPKTLAEIFHAQHLKLAVPKPITPEIQNALSKINDAVVAVQEAGITNLAGPTERTHKEVTTALSTHVPQINFESCSRPKGVIRAIEKSIRTNQNSSESFDDDSIGISIVTDSSKNILKIVKTLIAHLPENHHSFRMFNFQLLTPDEERDLKDYAGIIELRTMTNNHSDQNIQFFWFFGQFTTLGGQTHKYEIKLELKDNKNEEGMANHNIYELKQLIATITILYGHIETAHLTELINSTAKATGYPASDIWQYLLANHFIVEIDNTQGQRYRAIV